MPTVRESGDKDFEVAEWNGFFTGRHAAGRCRSVSSAVQEAMRQPEMRQRLIGMAIEPVGSSAPGVPRPSWPDSPPAGLNW
jgi:hypothetical protein